MGLQAYREIGADPSVQWVGAASSAASAACCRIGRITSARAPLGPRGSAGALPHALPTTCHRRLYHPRRHHRRYACPRRYRANRERTVLVPGSLAPGAPGKRQYDE